MKTKATEKTLATASRLSLSHVSFHRKNFIPKVILKALFVFSFIFLASFSTYSQIIIGSNSSGWSDLPPFGDGGDFNYGWSQTLYPSTIMPGTNTTITSICWNFHENDEGGCPCTAVTFNNVEVILAFYHGNLNTS